MEFKYYTIKPLVFDANCIDAFDDQYGLIEKYVSIQFAINYTIIRINSDDGIFKSGRYPFTANYENMEWWVFAQYTDDRNKPHDKSKGFNSKEECEEWCNEHWTSVCEANWLNQYTPITDEDI